MGSRRPSVDSGASRSYTWSLTRWRAPERARFSSRMIWRSLSISAVSSPRRSATSDMKSIPFSRRSRPLPGSVSWYVVWSKPVNAFWSRPKARPRDWKKGTTEPGGKLAEPLNAMCSR